MPFGRLGLNSFEKDVSGAVMDIEADEDEGMRRTKANKKWYIASYCRFALQ